MLAATAVPTRTEREIDAKLFLLYSLERHALLHNDYGEPVAVTIRAQIEVLRRRLTPKEAGERYEDSHLFVQSEALNAADWLCGIGECPSNGWASVGL